MYVHSHHILWQSVDQPGKVANNPARDQLNREERMFACRRTSTNYSTDYILYSYYILPGMAII